MSGLLAVGNRLSRPAWVARGPEGLVLFSDHRAPKPPTEEAPGHPHRPVIFLLIIPYQPPRSPNLPFHTSLARPSRTTVVANLSHSLVPLSNTLP